MLLKLSLTFLYLTQATGVGFEAPPVPVPVDFTDLEAVARFLFDAVMNRQWGVVVSLAITTLIAVLRKWVPETTKVGQFFKSKFGAVSSNFTIALGGAYFTMLKSGHVFNLDLNLKAVSIALGAAGGWAIFKNVKEAWDEWREKKAQSAGLAVVADPVKVDETLNK